VSKVCSAAQHEARLHVGHPDDITSALGAALLAYDVAVDSGVICSKLGVDSELLGNDPPQILAAGWGPNAGSESALLIAMPTYEGQGRPVSRILLYPAIHLREIPGLPWGSCAYQPDAVRPGNLACSHRWFTWPVPRGIPPVGSYPTLSPITCAGQLGGSRTAPTGHRLVCSLLHLTWRRAYAHPSLGLVSPSGLCYESGLCSTPRAGSLGPQRRVGRPGPGGLYLRSRPVGLSLSPDGGGRSWSV